MIVYYDIHKNPIFTRAFTDSGLTKADHFRGPFAVFMRQFHMQKYLPDLVYTPINHLDMDDKIIVFDSFSTPHYLNWVCKKNPDKRVILWFWNPVKVIRPDLYDNRVEFWTYSDSDSKTFGIRLNSQFFFDSLADLDYPVPHPSKSPRILFYGRDKNRKHDLLSLKAELDNAGASTDICLQRRTYPGLRGWFLNETRPYEEIIEMVKSYDIILDYTLDHNAGLSLRSMESLFFNKKLITNNLAVLRSDFYHPDNIYVIGHDTRTFDEFFSAPYQSTAPSVKRYYLLSSWYNRF